MSALGARRRPRPWASSARSWIPTSPATIPSVLTAEANRFDADAFVALTNSGEPGCALRVLLEPNVPFRGRALSRPAAHRVAARRCIDDVDEPVGRTYRFLRETRMTAVVCELVGPR